MPKPLTSTLDTTVHNSNLTRLVGALRNHRPDADRAAMMSLATQLDGALDSLRRPPAAAAAVGEETPADRERRHVRDRMAIRRSLSQVVEESRCDTSISEAFRALTRELAAPAAPRKKLVLIVDDATDVLVTLGAFLEGAGFEVLKASGADAALAIVAGPRAIDVLVSDLAMPGMSGVDLVQQALELRPALRAVIVTGFPDRALLAALPASINILRKPFRRADLIRCVHEMVSPAVPVPERTN